IVTLTEASADAIAAGEPTLYASNVRHVTFNAWLYSGTDIWPAFAAEVFRGVSDLDAELLEVGSQVAALVKFQDRVKADREHTAEIRRIEHELEVKEHELDEVRPSADSAPGKMAGTIDELLVSALALRKTWHGLRVVDLLPLALFGGAIALFAF